MWKNYYSVTSTREALRILANEGGQARIVAGATDLILELERGVRPGIDTLIDITRLPDLDQISLDEDGFIHLGPLVTHNRCVASPMLIEKAFPLVRAAWEVGAPQIRNRGTVAGNLITASPANDTITPLMALGASVRLRSIEKERVVPLDRFYTGVRRTVMQPDEMLVDIFFPAMSSTQRGTFIKLGLRRAQAIAVVNACVVLTLEGTQVRQAAISLGSVAPTIVRAFEAEKALEGAFLDARAIEQAASLAQAAVHPIDDVRSSSDYRLEMTRVSVLRCLRALSHGNERQGFPQQPVLLWGKYEPMGGERFNQPWSMHPVDKPPIETWINGTPYSFSSGYNKTLLRLLREEANLIGTKEGCAEGECGACTVFLDGVAVMSCLVPAPRAHHAQIVTVEGLAKDGALHPVQQAFIDQGAVQCGYCTPGFLMSAVKLLEERPNPDRMQIQQAITGNLCRCTGYYKIVQAIEQAAKTGS
jgi:xanthine dehydrogenase iron-sulfur cluster and FAD-binding subunit A